MSINRDAEVLLYENISKKRGLGEMTAIARLRRVVSTYPKTVPGLVPQPHSTSDLRTSPSINIQ